MGWRDLVIFGVLFGLVPLCLFRPYIGVLAFSWISYMNPHRLTWGAAFDFPFAKLMAAATLIGFVITVLREHRLPKPPLERETILLFLLWAMFLITTFTALRPDLAWPELKDISKVLLMTVLTLMLIDNEKKFKYLVLVIALSLGFYGFKGGIFSLATGGQYMVFGPPNSFIGDNTALGLALNMTLPLLYYLSREEESKWLKRLLQATFAFTILAVLFTYSRGAFLGLIVVLGLLFLRMKIHLKLAALILVIVALPFALSAIPDQWIDRVKTIQTYKQDGSAMSRLGAWKTAWLVAENRPLTGGGFQILDDVHYAKSFNPAFRKTDVGVHSVYLEVLSENGFVTFFIFLLLLLGTIASARRVQRLAREHKLQRYHSYGHMLEVSLFGYAVSGIFLEFASFDLFYQLVALVIVLKVLIRQQIAQLPHETSPTTQPIPGFAPVNART